MFEGKRILVADAECLRDVAHPFSFDKSQFLGNAVTCTLSNDGEYRDWIGDGSIFAMWKYMITFDIIVTYNGLSFDYPLWGGSILGAEHLEARKFFEKSFKGKSVDLCLDFHETLGARTKMTAVSVPTLGDNKELDGGFAPQLWRQGKCMEVIEYCRGDLRRTLGLFDLAIKGLPLKVQTKEGHIREFTCMPKIR
jgi:hypothetical protein